MCDSDANPVLRLRDSAASTGARSRPTWTNDNSAYPPGRDAIQRLAEKRIAEKRRAARRKQVTCLTRQSGGEQ